MTNSEINKFKGFYVVPGMFGVEVIADEGDLFMRLPGSPEGYETAVIPLEFGGYTLTGSPLAGLPISFEILENGETVGIDIGPYNLFRVDSFEGYELPRYLVTPALDLTPEKKTAFDALYQTALDHGPNYEIEYTLPYPKHEFLRYIGKNRDVILHGSNNLQISEFVPIRKSMELRDVSEHGNLPAIYGTHRGIWPMFFAVYDRVNTSGSIRNGPMKIQGRDGSSILLYQFSINKEWLDKNPWVTGAIYLLPRKTFTRLGIPGGGYLDEWASHEPVVPIAKLLVDPEDFPFLQGVGGHDDSELLEMATLEGEILEKTHSAEELENGFSLEIKWEKETASQIIRFIEIQRIYLPGLGIELHFEPDKGPIKLFLRSSGAIHHVYKKRLAKHLNSA